MKKKRDIKQMKRKELQDVNLTVLLNREKKSKLIIKSMINTFH